MKERQFTRLFRLCLIACALSLILVAGCGSDKPTSPTVNKASLAYQLDQLTSAKHLPGALGFITKHGTLHEIRADGVHRVGHTDTMTTHDLMHIGSLTKLMTATMIGKLVDEGLLTWTTKPADVIPGLDSILDSGFANVTLLDLLHHRAGVGADDDFDSIPTFSGTLRQQREQAAKWILSMPPTVPIGTFHYSNGGYVIAACMAEEVSDQDWRDLMKTRVFDPLGITPFYGWPTEHDANEPWGHIITSGTFESVDPSVEPANIKFAEPAGLLSMTMQDYDKFVRLHLNALRGNPQILTSATFQTLHTPVGNYGCGIASEDFPFGTVYWHNGTNGYFYTELYMVPSSDVAVVVGVNCGDTTIWSSVADAAQAVLQKLVLSTAAPSQFDQLRSQCTP